MDWTWQTLDFTSGQPARDAARTLETVLGVAIVEQHYPQGGVVFISADPSVENFSVSGDAVQVFTHRADAVIDTLTSAGFTLTRRGPHAPAHVQEARGAWMRLLPELRSRGWEIRVTCHAAPVQLEGVLPTGELFYYRCRHETCELSIGGDDPADIGEWNGGRELDSEVSASYLHPDEAVRILLELHVEWRRTR